MHVSEASCFEIEDLGTNLQMDLCSKVAVIKAEVGLSVCDHFLDKAFSISLGIVERLQKAFIIIHL